MSVRLKDVVVTNARALPETTDPDFTFRYVDISAVSQGHIEVPDESLRFEAAPSRARRLAMPGDTIVSTVRTYLRAVARVPTAPEPFVFSTGFAVLHPKREYIDDRYLSYYCTSAPFVESVVARSVGVSYPAINASEVADVRLDLPPLDEQRRIADFLDAETTHLKSIISRSLKVDALAIERADALADDALLGADADFQPLRRVVGGVTVGVVVNPSTYVAPDGTVPFYRGVDVRPFALDTAKAQRILAVLCHEVGDTGREA